MTGIAIAKSLELQLVQGMLTTAEFESELEQAAQCHLAAVVVWPNQVARAISVLGTSDLQVKVAIGFPYGQDTVETKIAAAQQALASGASQLALMIDASLFEAGSIPAARAELATLLASSYWSSLTSARGNNDVTIVVETMQRDVTLVRDLFADLDDAGAGFVQTGTGIQPRTVTEAHVRALREVLPASIGVTAVGGIATLVDAQELVQAGAVRIGSSSAIAIAKQEQYVRQVRGSS